MEIADYQPGEELEVCAWLGGRTIAEASAVERLTPDVFRWRYAKHPLSPAPRVVIARRNGQLLGYAAAIPSSLTIGGKTLRAMQLTFDCGHPEAVAPLHEALFARLGGDRVSLLYGSIAPEHHATYEAMSFVPLFEVHARNLYLGLSGVSRHLDQTLQPFRRFAEKAVSLRPKLVEMPFDDASLTLAAKMFAASQKREEPELALERSVEWLRWRYAERPEGQFRLLQVRRKAGAGIDALAIVRLFEYEPGRTFIQLMEHSTRDGGRRSMAWLLGEVAMWGLSARADVLQAFAATGSELDQALLGSGCIRKKRSKSFVVRWMESSPSPFGLPFPTKHLELCAGALEL